MDNRELVDILMVIVCRLDSLAHGKKICDESKEELDRIRRRLYLEIINREG